jgi:hypothetical protein
MMTWFTVVNVNTVLAYQAFLERYPNSDLAPTARRMRDHAKDRAQSANLTRGIPGAGNAPAPAVIPASLPAAPACACPVPAKKTEPVKPRRPGPPPRGSRPPVIEEEEEEIIIRRPPPRVIGPGPSIGIIIEGGRVRPPPYRPPARPRPPPPPPSCKPGQHCR